MISLAIHSDAFVSAIAKGNFLSGKRKTLLLFKVSSFINIFIDTKKSKYEMWNFMDEDDNFVYFGSSQLLQNVCIDYSLTVPAHG